jgi:hypothetical protein
MIAKVSDNAALTIRMISLRLHDNPAATVSDWRAHVNRLAVIPGRPRA